MKKLLITAALAASFLVPATLVLSSSEALAKKNCCNWGKKQVKMLSVKYCIDWRQYKRNGKRVRVACSDKKYQSSAGQICFVASNGRIFYDYRTYRGRIVVKVGQQFYQSPGSGNPNWPHLD